MVRETERLLASAALLCGQAGFFYAAIVHGLGIQPRSWLVFGVAVFGSALLSVLTKRLKEA